MSTLVLGGGRTRGHTRALVLSADGIAVASLAILGIALVALTWGTWGDLGRDTGYDLVPGSRVAHGQLPYADFPYYYGPIAPFVLGLAAFLGGDGIGPALAVGLAVSAVVVGGTHGLSPAFGGPPGPLLAGALLPRVARPPPPL